MSLGTSWVPSSVVFNGALKYLKCVWGWEVLKFDSENNSRGEDRRCDIVDPVIIIITIINIIIIIMAVQLTDSVSVIGFIQVPYD